MSKHLDFGKCFKPLDLLLKTAKWGHVHSTYFLGFFVIPCRQNSILKSFKVIIKKQTKILMFALQVNSFNS